MTRSNRRERLDLENRPRNWTSALMPVEQVPHLIIYPLTAGRCWKWPHQQQHHLVCVCVWKRESITRIFGTMIHYFFLKINLLRQTEAAPQFFRLHFHLLFLTRLQARRSVMWVSNANLAKRWWGSPRHSVWPGGTLAGPSASDVTSDPAHQLIIKHGTVLQPQVTGKRQRWPHRHPPRGANKQEQPHLGRK